MKVVNNFIYYIKVLKTYTKVQTQINLILYFNYTNYFLLLKNTKYL